MQDNATLDGSLTKSNPSQNCSGEMFNYYKSIFKQIIITTILKTSEFSGKLWIQAIISNSFDS